MFSITDMSNMSSVSNMSKIEINGFDMIVY